MKPPTMYSCFCYYPDGSIGTLAVFEYNLTDAREKASKHFIAPVQWINVYPTDLP